MIPVAILAIFLLQSCGFGYSVHQNFTPLNEQKITNCDTPVKNVELLFEGEKIDLEYEKIGLIEVQGERFSNDAELIESIKKLAQSKCCDVIINLKKSYTNRESGIVFSDEPEEKYSAITYHGIAVRKVVSETATTGNDALR